MVGGSGMRGERRGWGIVLGLRLGGDSVGDGDGDSVGAGYNVNRYT